MSTVKDPKVKKKKNSKTTSTSSKGSKPSDNDTKQNKDDFFSNPLYRTSTSITPEDFHVINDFASQAGGSKKKKKLKPKASANEGIPNPLYEGAFEDDE